MDKATWTFEENTERVFGSDPEAQCFKTEAHRRGLYARVVHSWARGSVVLVGTKTAPFGGF